MNARNRFLGFMLATALSAPAAFAASGDSSARISEVKAPPGTDAATRAALGKSLQRYISEEGLTESLKRYSLSPSLVQLRRYVEESQGKPKLVCVVDLALVDGGGNVAGSVRGNVSTRGVSQLETLDAAARAAVIRLPGALQALDARDKTDRVASR